MEPNEYGFGKHTIDETVKDVLEDIMGAGESLTGDNLGNFQSAMAKKLTSNTILTRK